MPRPFRLAINTPEVSRDSIPRNESPEPDAGSNGRVPRLRDAGGGQGRAQRVRPQRMNPASMFQSGHSRGAGTPRLGWMSLDLAGFAWIYRIAVVPLVSNPAFRPSFAFTCKAWRHEPESRTSNTNNSDEPGFAWIYPDCPLPPAPSGSANSAGRPRSL